MTRIIKTRRYNRHTFGDSGANSEKNILSVSFAYTKTQKVLAAADADGVLAATASTAGTQSITDGLTAPDVARNLTVTLGGTAADVPADGDIVVTGTNSEGATITETFSTTENTAETLTGNKAFRTVASVALPAFDGTGATVTVGTGDKIGLSHRTTSATVFNVLTNISGVKALEAAAANANSTTAIESNTVTPTTAPDGATGYTIFYYNPTWHLNPTNDNPAYGV